MTRRVKLTLTISGIVALAAILLLYAGFNPADNPFPRCVFLSLTEFKCPGCGSQRALHALLHAEFGQAWHYNPLLIISIPFLALLAFSQVMKRRFTKLYNNLNGGMVIWTVFIIVIAWWIFRNIFDW